MAVIAPAPRRDEPEEGYASRLPAAALAYLNLRSTIEVGLSSVALVVAVLVFCPVAWRPIALAVITALAVIALVVDLPILNRLKVRFTSYRVDPYEVRIRHGVLLTRDLTIATPQIVDVTVLEGPLLRRFGLARVGLTTITHVEPLGPLTLAEARAVREVLTAAAWGRGG